MTKLKPVAAGIGFAVLATLIWSGNFIIARDAKDNIPPVSLAFYRWLVATIILLPFAMKNIGAAFRLVRANIFYFLLTALTGITLFNTFVYVAGQYSSAISMALIGTTTSPIISVILAAIILKERITAPRIIGMIICITGILLLLCRGNIQLLSSFSFSRGDLWILAAALSFSIYNTMVRKRPKEMTSIHFLFICFLIGTLLLLPVYLIELNNKGSFDISGKNIAIIIYLGLGTSVIAFLCWNFAIARLGAGRAALFGNLIPVFSAIEAVIILGEKISWYHFAGFLLVVTGLVIANTGAIKRNV